LSDVDVLFLLTDAERARRGRDADERMGEERERIDAEEACRCA
jgi:hypothetical protein